jgi:Na+-driven multidrug efflux pump
MYLRVALPGIYLDCILQSISIFFTSMQKSYIPMLVQMVFIPLHPFWCRLLVQYYGYEGTAMAYNLTIGLSLISIIGYVRATSNTEIQQVWVPFNIDIINSMGVFIRLAFSGLLLFCFEEWCNQGIQFISGFLGVDDQAAMVITFSMVIMIIFVPLSFGFATSALIGSALGQGNAKMAR